MLVLIESVPILASGAQQVVLSTPIIDPLASHQWTKTTYTLSYHCICTMYGPKPSTDKAIRITKDRKGVGQDTNPMREIGVV